MDGFVKGRLVTATVHQNRFRAEHFGDLRQHCRAALGDEPVGKAAEERIGRNAGKAVGAAALEADAKFRDGDILAFVLRNHLEDLPEAFQTVLKFVLNLLGREHFYPALINRADLLAEGVELVVFTAETHDEHSSGVGVMDHVGEDRPRVLVVVAELGAAVVVGEGHDGVDRAFTPCDLASELLCELLTDAVDTAHCRDDPYLVADTHLPVGTAEAFE